MFPTVRFAVFFAATWCVLAMLRGRPRAWKLALLVANWVFYAMWATGMMAVLAASIIFNHLAVRLVGGARGAGARRAAFVGGIVVNVAVLATFKYYDFFATSAAQALRRLGLSVEPPLLGLVLPLGISFFTFQAISYLVEVRWGSVAPAPFLDEAVWLSFFPIVISGPLTRPSELFPQLARAGDGQSEVDLGEASLLFVRGMVKKVVVASFLASAIVDDVFANPRAFSSVEVMVGIYAYAGVVYADFSGYTDMARGAALLLGLRPPVNFTNPYRAQTVRDFWARWHQTLSAWIRDFVFFPLGRHDGPSRRKTYRNLVLVMALVGLWHGAAWTYLAFGTVHGMALVVERAHRDRARDRLRRRRRAGTEPAPRPAPVRSGAARWARPVGRWLVTFHVVCLGWVFFRSDSLTDAGRLLAQVGALRTSTGALSLRLVAVVVGVVAAQFVPLRAWGRVVAAFTDLVPAAQVVLLAASLTVIDVLGPQGVAPFIYYRF